MKTKEARTPDQRSPMSARSDGAETVVPLGYLFHTHPHINNSPEKQLSSSPFQATIAKSCTSLSKLKNSKKINASS
jgi:hypothetical protein